MDVLIGCEYSGTVRDAFIARGHNAMSCDLLATDAPGPHWQGDIFECLEFYNYDFDLMICHPPCTDLAVSGARYFAEKKADGRQGAALNFVRRLMNAPIEKIALENPVSIISSHIRKPDQIIQPYDFGHTTSKKTCLWLKNLPLLKSTHSIEKDKITYDIHLAPPSKDRWKIRSKTFDGIAHAMADQWGDFESGIMRSKKISQIKIF